MNAAQAINTIGVNFGRLDTAGAGSIKDGLISKSDLTAVLKDQNIPQDLRDAANFLLNNPSAFNEAETATQPNGTAGDGHLSLGDVNKYLGNHAVTPNPPVTVTPPVTAKPSASLSIADMVKMLGPIMDMLQKNIKTKVDDLKKKEEAAAKEAASKTGAGGLTSSDTQELQSMSEVLKSFSQILQGMIKLVSDSTNKFADKIGG